MDTIAERTSTRQPTTTSSPGTRLKAARIALKLSVRDAANRLHIKPHIISLMEDDQFDHALPEIFMRGFFRSYARFLNFSAEEITQALREINLSPPPSQINYVPNRKFNLQQHDRYVHWVTYVVLIAVGTMVGLWWWSVHTTNLNSLTELARQKVTAMMAPAVTPAPASTPFHLSRARIENTAITDPAFSAANASSKNLLPAPTNPSLASDIKTNQSNAQSSPNNKPLPGAHDNQTNKPVVVSPTTTPATSQQVESPTSETDVPSDFAMDVPESGL